MIGLMTKVRKHHKNSDWGGGTSKKEGKSNTLPLQIKSAEMSGRDYPVLNSVNTNQEQSLLHLPFT